MAVIKNKKRKLRFMATGAISTSIDFGLLFLLKYLGLNSIVANFISTGLAFCFSFFANQRFTFKAHNHGNTKRQFVLFFVFTFIGIWIYQPIIIYFIEPVFEGLGYQQFVSLAIAKLAATSVTLVWNYLTYSRFVFKKTSEQ